MNFSKYTQDLTLLLIEDDVSLATTLTESFSFLFKTVHTYHDATAALAFYQEHYNDIDVVMTDILMDDLDGIELCRQIKAIDPFQKIIIHSGCQDIEVFKKIRDVHVDKLIPKPSSSEVFLNCFKDIGRDVMIMKKVKNKIDGSRVI